MLIAVLQARAYLCLLRGAAGLALADARALLALEPPPEARLLARLYAAEALCLLGQQGEAAEQLSASLKECDEAESRQMDDGERAAAPTGTARLDALRGDAARSSVKVNLAGALCAQGDLAAAHACASSALTLRPDSLPALLALVHVELRRGDQPRALALLRSHALQG